MEPLAIARHRIIFLLFTVFVVMVMPGCETNEIETATPPGPVIVPTLTLTGSPTGNPGEIPEAIPQETAQPSPTPDLPSFSSFPCPELSCVWRLDQQTPQLIPLHDQVEVAYDYSTATNRLLHGHFSGRGAGPGNIAVTDLQFLDLDNSENRQIVAVENIAEAVWAPNGQDIAYVRATSRAYELHWLAGFQEDRLLANEVAFTLSVSPAGDKVAFTRESNLNPRSQPGLYVVDTNTGEERIISEVDRAGRGSVADRPIWSPDGTQILLPVAGETLPHRFLRASVDGSSAAYLEISPSVEGQMAGGTLGGIILWHPDNRRLVGQVFPDVFGPEPRRIFSFELDPSLGQMVSAGLIFEGEGELVGWAEPGESIWIRSQSNELALVPLD
jgi:hypothetical protein